MNAASSPSNDYPYGLMISLGHEELAKLGIDDLPEVGAEMMIQCKVKVCSTVEHEDQNGERNHMSLQITDMAISGDKKSKAEVFYA